MPGAGPCGHLSASLIKGREEGFYSLSHLIYLPSQVQPCQCPHYTFCLPLNVSHAGASSMCRTLQWVNFSQANGNQLTALGSQGTGQKQRGRSGSGLCESPTHLAPGLPESWSGVVGTLAWVYKRVSWVGMLTSQPPSGISASLLHPNPFLPFY